MVMPGNLPTCFLVDADTPGFDVRTTADHDVSSFRVPLVLTFKDCHVTRANRLGDEGAAFALGRKWLPARRIIRGAGKVGVARRLLEEATLRAQTWQSFGRPVAERPGVRAALAEAATDIHACRLLVHEAAWKADRGDNVRREAAMVKAFAHQMIRNVTDRVAHVYGGPPYTDPLLQRLRQDDLAAGMAGMAADLQKHIIASDVLKGLKF
jgi:acyl-CoA dehydrogenase